ncbi:MAG: hypothetical protein ABIQ60_16480 [Burkholderiaceae bacterium]
MMKRHVIAIAAVTLLASNLAAAQASAPGNSNARPAVTATTTAPMAPMSRQARMDRDKAYKGEKDALEEKLKAGNARADYAKILEANGYRISSINADKKDYLEYEVVKGNHSYEVQLDFDKGAAKATKIDVTTNIWRTDATKKMLRDANYKHPGPLVADKDSSYSDRRNIKGWTDEKNQLEKALAPNMKVSDYRPKLEKMGYKITSVNEREADYVEYEILKGNHTYEVQIDVDPATKMAKKVDVTTNLWDAEGTDRAKENKEAVKAKK